MRDTEQTKKKIVEAVGKLLSQKGFGGIGINAIAREAGVDKVLIYRYFGGLPELLRQFASQGNFWPSLGELLGKPMERFGNLMEAGKAILLGHFRELRQRPTTQEIMRWELLERNELTDELARFREQQGMEILQQLPNGNPDDDRDLAAMAAILHAGISYLVLRGKTADVYLGIELNTDEGAKRLTKAIEKLVETVFK